MLSKLKYSETLTRVFTLSLFFASIVFSSSLYAAGLIKKNEGDARLMVRAYTAFNQYTSNPSASEKAWMREHYDRMLVYSSYFDSRISWYPDGWVYKDLFALKPEWSITQQNPSWILRDQNGTPLYIPFDCSGGTCTQYAGDFGNPAFRNWWINTARSVINKGYNGMFIDDVNFTWRVSDGNGNHVTPIDPRTGQKMTLTNWRRYMAVFLEQIRAAFPNIEIAHNMVWFAAPADDPYLRRAVAAADVVHLERGGSDAGLRGGDKTNKKWGYQTYLRFIDAIHNQGASVGMRDNGTSTTLREYGLATWLLISKGKDIYGVDVNSWIAPDTYWSGFDVDLGTAEENWVRQSNGLVRRQFSCGVVYLNQPEQPSTFQSLGSSMQRLNGNVVSGVNLGPKTAAILKKQNCSTSGGNNGGNTGTAENLTTWKKTSGMQVTSLGGDRYRLTHPGTNWPILRKTISNLPDGASLRVRFNGRSSPGGAELRISNWPLAETGGGHFRMSSTATNYDRTFTNNTGSALSNFDLRFYFADSSVSGAGQTITIDNLIVDGGSTSSGTALNTTIRQDILGSTVNTPLSLTGVATAGAGVDYVWLAIRDLTRDQWWNGNGWQNAYTRIRKNPATAGVSANWSHWFAPGRTGTFQAFARTVDLDGNADPSSAQVWFRN